MLEIITYGVPLILVSLVGAYLYVEAQRKKAIEESKKAVIIRVASVKDKFKAELKRFVEQEILTIKQHESLYRIANNFFVFQPITDKSIEFCEYSLNNVISAIPNNGPESLHFDRIQEQIKLFIRALPVQPNDYNGKFYRKDLPKLIKRLVDSKDDIYKVESEPCELSNEESVILDSTEAA